MPKKIVKFIATSFIIISFLNIYGSIHINAVTTATVYLKCNIDIVEKGEEIELSFYISDQKTAAYNINLYFDKSKFEFVSGPENINIQENKIIIVWYDQLGGGGAKQGELGKIIFKAKENGIANFVAEGEFYSEKGQLIQTNFEATQVQIGREEGNLKEQIEKEQGTNTQKDNANLQALRLDKEGIVPDFQTNVYEYDLTISNDISSIDVLAIAENPNSQIEITGNNQLNEGLNLIKINVISEDKTNNKIYTIKTTKTSNIELANTNLEILAIENTLLTPPFDNHITKYSTEVSNTINKLNILAVPENENAKIEILNNEDIKEGNNIINVIVTAQNGITKREYQVNVYKRNAQEEANYIEEQSKQKEKLEEAYEIEKTTLMNEQNAREDNKNVKNYIIIGIISIITVLFIVTMLIFYKKRKTHQKG